ncbi:acid-sensing ion channel 3-like [Saccoglossus kowalevskii]
MKYTDVLLFPAVTVCNYNRYRKSYIQGTTFAEWQQTLYHPINLIHGSTTINWTTDAAIEELAKNRTYLELSAAHQKESMILECKLGRASSGCNAVDNFTTTLTDYGVCYTYNNALSNHMLVTESGSRHGLSLTLNLEQEEYTYGQNYGAGFKIDIRYKLSNVLILCTHLTCVVFVGFIGIGRYRYRYLNLQILVHFPGDVPLVTDFGTAVSPGTEVFMPVRLVVEKNKESPYRTNCTNVSLEYYAHYTKSNCIMEKVTQMVVSKCGCREPYMPGNVRVCNYQEKEECVQSRK